MEFFLGMVTVTGILAVIVTISAIVEWKDNLREELTGCRAEGSRSASMIRMMGDDIKRLKTEHHNLLLKVEKLEEGNEQASPDIQERPDDYDKRRAQRDADINRKRSGDSDGQEDVS